MRFYSLDRLCRGVIFGCNMKTKIPTYKFALREDLKNNHEFLPAKGEPFASGWDVRAALESGPGTSLEIKPFQHVKIPLGFRTYCPEGWWFELKPRSSTFGKKFLHALYGTIDESFQGILVFACQYIPTMDISNINSVQNLKISFGEAIGQIIPVKRQEMIVECIDNKEYDSLCEKRNAPRKDGGFGSTDK